MCCTCLCHYAAVEVAAVEIPWLQIAHHHHNHHHHLLLFHHHHKLHQIQHLQHCHQQQNCQNTSFNICIMFRSEDLEKLFSLPNMRPQSPFCSQQLLLMLLCNKKWKKPLNNAFMATVLVGVLCSGSHRPLSLRGNSANLTPQNFWLWTENTIIINIINNNNNSFQYLSWL